MDSGDIDENEIPAKRARKAKSNAIERINERHREPPFPQVLNQAQMRSIFGHARAKGPDREETHPSIGSTNDNTSIG